jgi:lipopolysaccharide assembly outer membrane protein LptD (OstA)
VLALLLALSAPPLRAGSAAVSAVELRADEVTLRDGGAVVEARGRVRVAWGASRLSADRATYTVGLRRLSLVGSVTVIMPQGTLTSARATVVLAPRGGLESLEASGRATLRSEQRVVRAEHLTYAVQSGAVTADGGVELTIPPGITARGQRLLMKRGEAATLRGRARVQTQDGSLEADQIDVSEPAQVAYARGHVAGIFEETRITADAATFYHRERRAVFRDGVTVTRPGRTIQADVVTIYLHDRRIVAEGDTTIRLEEEPGRP